MNTPIPLPVERALKRLGRSLSLARRRRRMSQAMLAERIGASVTTVRRMEDGYSGIAVAHLARALHVMGELDRFNTLLDTPTDELGLALMDERLPQRVRQPRRSDDSGAL